MVPHRRYFFREYLAAVHTEYPARVAVGDFAEGADVVLAFAEPRAEHVCELDEERKREYEERHAPRREHPVGVPVRRERGESQRGGGKQDDGKRSELICRIIEQKNRNQAGERGRDVRMSQHSAVFAQEFFFHVLPLLSVLAVNIS